jgi:tetratricopeptide (TPR) repeat protein
MESEVSKTLNNIGLCYEGKGDFEKAIVTYQELFQWDSKTKNYLGMALTVSHIGYIYERHMADKQTAYLKYQESVPYFEKAIESYRESGSTSGMAKALYDLGFVYTRYLEEQEKGLATYEESLTLAKQTDASGLAAKILEDIATIHASKREFEKASAALQEAASFYKKTGHYKKVSKALRNAALACVIRRDYQAAISQYEELVQWHREIDDDLGAAVALNNVGLIYKNHLNAPNAAQGKFLEALRILKKIGNEKYIHLVEKNLALN